MNTLSTTKHTISLATCIFAYVYNVLWMGNSLVLYVIVYLATSFPLFIEAAKEANVHYTITVTKVFINVWNYLNSVT